MLITIYGDPKQCHSPNSVLWTAVVCARPRLYHPKHAVAPRPHNNQTSQGLDPNLYTRIDSIAPTPHANFRRSQLFPVIANPSTILGHMPPHSTFHPFLPNTGTHVQNTKRLRPKTTTLPHLTTPVFLKFFIYVCWVSVEVHCIPCTRRNKWSFSQKRAAGGRMKHGGCVR